MVFSLNASLTEATCSVETILKMFNYHHKATIISIFREITVSSMLL